MHLNLSVTPRVLTVLCACVLFYVAQRFWVARANLLIGRLRGTGQRRWARLLLNLTAVFIVFCLATRLFHLFHSHGLALWLIGLSQLWLFASSAAFVAVKTVHATEWAWKRLHQAFANRTTAQSASTGRSGVEAVDTGRRDFFRYAACLAGSVPFAAGIYGFAGERLHYAVQRVEVPMANLPPALDGLRIVHLSDIHIGDFLPREQVRRAVSIARALQPDLAVVTGDFVTDSSDPLEECIAELSRLGAPLGTWGCNGNHEIYAHGEDATETLFQRYGMRLLRQNSAQLAWRGEKLNLIGVDYQREFIGRSRAALPMLEGIAPLVRRDMPNILLSHNPNSFRRAAELGIELSLAGHTHGGQIRIEIVDDLSPARFFTDFVAGLYHLPLRGQTPDAAVGTAGPQALLYVNRGLGTIAVPARLGSEPEITLLTLRAPRPR